MKRYKPLFEKNYNIPEKDILSFIEYIKTNSKAIDILFEVLRYVKIGFKSNSPIKISKEDIEWLQNIPIIVRPIKTIYRGISSDTKLNKKLVYEPQQDFSSWTSQKAVAIKFLKIARRKKYKVILQSEITQNTPYINIRLIVSLCLSLYNYLKELPEKTSRQNYILDKLKWSITIKPEDEYLIFGKINAEIIFQEEA